MPLHVITACNIFLIFLIIACNNSERGESNSVESNVGTVITVDSSGPQNYFDQIEDNKYPNDTLLSSGWSVKYYVKDDSTSV
jgi:hypothetical protein